MPVKDTSQGQSPEPDTSQDRHLAIRQSLREQLRSRRSRLSESEVVSHSAAIAKNVRALIGNAQHIAGYLAIGQEVRLDAVLDSLRQSQRTTYVPVVRPGENLVFVRIDDSTPLHARQFGIMEPDSSSEPCLDPESLDLVLMPLVGFDALCNRMGMGGGYYDRTFAHRRTSDAPKPLLVGVAYECQAVDSVLPDWWDVPLDYIVTQTRVLSAQEGLTQKHTNHRETDRQTDRQTNKQTNR